MKIKLKIFFILLLNFLAINLYSVTRSGVLSSSKGDISVIKTKYFDIIYPEECKNSAEKIFSVCDSMYEQICLNLNTVCYQRFPVTITKSVEELNAYFSAVPYNRIVLYDTFVNSELDTYKNTLESVFYHELTHAVTLNMKNGFWKFLSNVFADSLNPAWISLSTFWNEGATVSFESKNQDGRLNNPFNTQILIQAKIEDKFPSWRDVTGSRDIYPGQNASYLFGAGFANYLQQTYGMKKYSDFWKQAGSSISLSFCSGVFEKVYNLKLSDCWNDYKNSIIIPNSIKHEIELYKYWKGNTKNSQITQMDSSNYGIVWYENKGNSVYYAEKKESDYCFSEVKKIISIPTVNRLSLSNDGNFLAITTIKEKDNRKSIIYIYDLKKEKFVFKTDTGLFDGFIYSDSKSNYHLVAISYDSTFVINSFIIDFENKTYTKEKVYKLKKNALAFNPCYYDDGKIAFIYRENLDWCIRITDGITSFDYKTSLSNEKNIIRNLKITEKNNEKSFYFSWAKFNSFGEMLPRFGILTVHDKEGSLILQNQDFSGGVHNPVPITSEKLMCINSFYENKNISELNLNTIKTESTKITAEISVENDKKDINFNLNTQEKICKYNPFTYYKNGILLPVSSVPLYNSDWDIEEISLLGFSFISSNPWGDKIISLSAGYGFENKFYGIKGSITGGNNSYSYTFSGDSKFNSEGFLQSSEEIVFSKVIYNEHFNTINFGFNGMFNFEKDDFYTVNVASLSYSNVHRVAEGYWQFGGIYLEPFIYGECNSSKNVNLGFAFGAYVPGVFPLSFSFDLFPNSLYFAHFYTKAVLFSTEIQKGIPLLSIYVDRFFISALYNGKIYYNSQQNFEIMNTYSIAKDVTIDEYSDYLGLRFEVMSGLNTGIFANPSSTLSIYGTLYFRPHCKNYQNKNGFSVGCNLVY